MLIGLGVGVLAVFIAAAILIATRDAPELDPTTPEGVAQQFVLASFERDVEGMRSYLTTDLAERCVDLDRIWYETPSRAVITDSSINGDRATVTVELTTTSGNSPFELSQYGWDFTLFMQQTDQGWRIAEPDWPLNCPPEVAS
jgi:hypothetical protein